MALNDKQITNLLSGALSDIEKIDLLNDFRDMNNLCTKMESN